MSLLLSLSLSPASPTGIRKGGCQRRPGESQYSQWGGQSYVCCGLKAEYGGEETAGHLRWGKTENENAGVGGLMTRWEATPVVWDRGAGTEEWQVDRKAVRDTCCIFSSFSGMCVSAHRRCKARPVKIDLFLNAAAVCHVVKGIKCRLYFNCSGFRSVQTNL